MGSGHFVVAMFERLVALRLAEEKLDEAAAVAAVIRDNLFGLEIDPRCTQIGAFNLALAAWRRVGHCKLPAMNLACSGLAPNTREADWLAIAGDNQKLQRGMERLYRLFQKAAVLGSLINPRAGEGDLLVAAFHELQPLLEKALAQETKDDTAHEMAVTARGLAKAAEILAGQFTLVATNVPYLGLRKQCETLRDFCVDNYPKSKHDLACVFIERCLQFTETRCSIALVSPRSWTYKDYFDELRESLLEKSALRTLAILGPGAFETISGEVVDVALFSADSQLPKRDHQLYALDLSGTVGAKSTLLHASELIAIDQLKQLKNPDHRISVYKLHGGKLLEEYAVIPQGIKTGDDGKWIVQFWELPSMLKGWEFCQSSTAYTGDFGGREYIIDWRTKGLGMIRPRLGSLAVGKNGVGVSQTGELRLSLYSGQRFDSKVAPIVPHKQADLLAIWAFCTSVGYADSLTKLNPGLFTTNSAFLKVPFDLAHWQKVAAEKYPHGLPKPFSSDPTQWLFNGHPAGADQPLHVAVARLLGYQWPRQTGSSFPDCPALGPDGLEKIADNDGIVCLPPLNREQPAAARLRNLLAAALGKFDQRALLNAAYAKKTTLEDWLRDEFFEQHCAFFHHRPFLWHIWDGRKDGFSALVNYHRLNHANLQKLTYTYLGSWINDQEAAAKADTPGAAERLLAAQELQKELAKILEGEQPHDIFVRWKPIGKQARGWHPDINDGVRLNIRPFLLAKDVGKKGAGILRSKPNIKWDKDRGKEPQRPKNEYPWFWCDSEPGIDPVGGKTFAGHRWNNVHLTLAYKGGATS